jgi:hypothetical protein
MPDRRRRGLVILLWAGFLYLLALVVVDAFIDDCKPELRSSYLVDVFRRLRDTRDPDVVCLGTSRFGLAFSPEEVQAEMRRLTGDSELVVFNASISAQDFHTADFTLREMLARGARPGLVVIEINPETVARHNIWLGGHVMPPIRRKNLGLYLGELGQSLDRIPNLLADHAYPLHRCRREIWKVYAGDFLETKASKVVRRANSARARKGTPGKTRARLSTAKKQAYEKFLEGNPNADSWARTLQGVGMIRKWLADYQVGGLPVWSLERLIRHCRHRDMIVVLSTAPVASAQRGLYTPEIEAAFQEYCRHLQRDYQCVLVDYRDAVPDDCFFDNHHVLIPQGSRPFSRRLAAEVLAPAWLGHGEMHLAEARPR